MPIITVLPAKSDVMFCLQSYQGLRIVQVTGVLLKETSSVTMNILKKNIFFLNHL